MLLRLEVRPQQRRQQLPGIGSERPMRHPQALSHSGVRQNLTDRLPVLQVGTQAASKKVPLDRSLYLRSARM